MSSFENKVILITGAKSGLGATAAVSLAGKGAKVAITGRRLRRAVNCSLCGKAFLPFCRSKADLIGPDPKTDFCKTLSTLA